MRKNFKIITLILLSFLFNRGYSQVSLSVIPDTPLDYFVFEASTPKIKSGYNVRDNYFSSILIGSIIANKYSDLPIYNYFAETASFINDLETKTQINRTTSFVAYTLDARENSTDPFVTYAKDTFFLNNNKITTISETIYDGSDVSYAKYSINYNSNGKVEEIKFVSGTGNNAQFGGLKVIFNTNNTIKSDTIYARSLSGSGVERDEYTDYFYNTNNLLKVDSAYHYSENTIPKQSERQFFSSNTSNEIVQIAYFTYDSNSNSYEEANTFKFGTSAISMVKNASNREELVLFPNPAHETIFINNNILTANYSIYDEKGNVVTNGQYNGMNGISVASLQTGYYLLRLSNNDKIWLGRFVK